MEDNYTVLRGPLHQLAHEISLAVERALNEGVKPDLVADLLLLFVEGLRRRAEAVDALIEALSLEGGSR